MIRSPWLALSLSIILSQVNAAPLTNRSPTLSSEQAMIHTELGGCTHLTIRRECGLPVQDGVATLTLWVAAERETDVEVRVDGTLQTSLPRWPVQGGLQIEVEVPAHAKALEVANIGPIPGGDGALRARRWSWRLIPPAPACDIERMLRRPEQPECVLRSAKMLREQGRLSEGAEEFLRAGDLFLGRGDLSRAVDAYHVAANYARPRNNIAGDTAKTRWILHRSRDALAHAQDQDVVYRGGWAYQRYLEGLIAQDEGLPIAAYGATLYAVHHALRVQDIDALADALMQLADVRLSAGQDPGDLHQPRLARLPRWVLKLAPRHLRREPPTLPELIQRLDDGDKTPRDRCKHVPSLYTNLGWIYYRMSAAGDRELAKLAIDAFQKAIAVYGECMFAVPEYVTTYSEHGVEAHLQLALALLRVDRAAEARRELELIARVADGLAPSNGFLYEYAWALLDLQVGSRELGLGALKRLLAEADRTEDRWLAAITLARAYSETDGLRAELFFQRADELVAETVAPQLGGQLAKDPARNGGAHVEHLLGRGEIEEAACVARQARAWQARPYTPGRDSGRLLMLRKMQLTMELYAHSYSEDGRKRVAELIREQLSDEEREHQMEAGPGVRRYCDSLAKPRPGARLLVFQPLPDGGAAIFSLGQEDVKVIRTGANECIDLSDTALGIDGADEVYILADVDDQAAGAAYDGISRRNDRLVAYTREVEPGSNRQGAQGEDPKPLIWYDERSQLAGGGAQVRRLEDILRGVGVEYVPETIAAPQVWLDRLYTGPRRSLLVVMTHGEMGSIRAHDGQMIRPIDFALGQGGARVVILAACEVDAAGPVLLDAGSELVIAGRGQLDDARASAWIDHLVSPSGDDVDYDRLARVTSAHKGDWVVYKKMPSAPKNFMIGSHYEVSASELGGS